MGKVCLSWVIHNHQPEGNFPWVIDYAYQHSYEPFLELLERTGLKVALHNSGTLWEYFEERTPEYVDRVQRLVDLGQVELLGGTLYEAILAMIPDLDKHNQLRLLKEYIEQRFETPVNGAWVTERVWEPHLPKFYQEAGYQYVFLDDYHFAQAGELPPFHGYYLTEDQGYQVFVFSINKELRYLIPWQPPKKVLHYLETLAKNGDVYLVYGDDGEKFGLWPGTYNVCYEEKYLEKLVLELSKAGVEFVLPSEILEKTTHTGLVYLPTGTYPEMSEWALEPAALEQYKQARAALSEKERIWLHAGFWRQFLKRHPETRWMYGRTVTISRYLNTLAVRHPRKHKALRELYRAQANDVFWHGVFGGLYLAHLRRNVYKRLTRAKLTADGRKRIYLEVQDFDLDGREELMAATPAYHAYVDAKGVFIRELDLLRCEDNLLDILDPQGAVHGILLDRWNGEVVEYAAKSVSPRFMVASFKSEQTGIAKELSFGTKKISCRYKFKEAGTLAVELPINLWNPKSTVQTDHKAMSLGEEDEQEMTTFVELTVEDTKLRVHWEPDSRIIVSPIYMEHPSEHGSEVTYQGAILYIVIGADKDGSAKIDIEIEEGEVG